MKSSASLIPERRFPGFSGPWAHEPLASVLTEHKVKNTAGHEVFSVSMESGIVNQIEHLGRSFAAADTSHYNVGHRFDVVYTKSPLKAFPFGIVKQCKFEREVALSPLYGVFTPKNPHLGLMIEAYFEAPERAQAFLSPLCQKGAKNTLQITNATFLSGRLAFPKEEDEQKKIADCLDSADALIAAQGRKVEALRGHKKGLMQQLLPQQGETQPRFRFPEFAGTGEWSLASLGELADIITGKTPSTTEAELWGGDILFITPTDIADQNKYQRTTDRTVVATKSTKILPIGSIVYTCIGSIGKMVITVSPSITNQQINAVVPRRRAPGEFIYYVLENLTPWIKTITASNTLPIINKTDFSKIEIPCPPDTAEQKHIADCLTSLDDLIAAETRKLDMLKTHKKGLMQQLFPQVGEDNA